MPKEGLSTVKNQLGLYASLSFYFDGEDLKKANIKKIKAKQEKMDTLYPPREYQIEELDDQINLVFSESEQYIFLVPSLDTMPEINQEDQPGSIRDSIKKLADRPDEIFNLAYSDFGAVTELLGKCLGFS